MRTIVWDNRVDITLAGGLFGISITQGSDEYDKDLLHLHVKQSITEEYIGNISKSETGKPAVFTPCKINNIVKEHCDNCKYWVECKHLPANSCNNAYNTIAIPTHSELITPPNGWCKNWKEKTDGT